MIGRRCRLVAGVCDEAAGHDLGPSLDAVQAVREGLDEPLRVAIAGRVNAGKSTLVNALLGQRVAPTDVSECTRLVTWYRHGVPERLELRRHDGSRRRLPLEPDGSLPRSFGEDPETIAAAEVWLPNDALHELTVIDTPGLSSTNEAASAATAELLAIDGASRTAIAHADALLFVLSLGIHADEAAALSAFRRLHGGIRTSATNTVAVLNKADQIETGGGTPWEAAGAIADRYAHELRDRVATVVPLIGLLAETAGCGLLTEENAGHLRVLASLPPARRELLLASVDRFVATTPTEVPAPDRASLLKRLDLYGARRALEAIDAGVVGAAALVPLLRDWSGVGALQEVIGGVLTRDADALKADRALASLERIAFGLPDGPARAWLIDETERLRLHPDMHRLREIAVLRDVTAGRVHLPDELSTDLRRLVTGRGLHGRLGADSQASGPELRDAAAAAVGRWKTFTNDGRAGPGPQRVADTAVRSYELAWIEAGRLTSAGGVR